jgi:antirestriction protein ArdC
MAIANATDSSQQVQFKTLLEEAVTKPGTLMRAYSLFWTYSLGNQLLAVMQAAERNIPLGPIASFNRWKELGRHVNKGQKAISLVMPVTMKKTLKEQQSDGTEAEKEIAFKRFLVKRNWFFLSQTSGVDYVPPAIPAWDRARALVTLNIEEIPFQSLNGNVQGYAKARQIAVSPIAAMPHKTTFHEIAHVLLEHTSEAVHDTDEMERSLRETEAEATAMLCCEALGLPGADQARGYIQAWYGTGNPIPERSAQRILSAADKILKAGIERPAQGGAE